MSRFIADDAAKFRLSRWPRRKQSAMVRLKSDELMHVVAVWDGSQLTMIVDDHVVVPRILSRRRRQIATALQAAVMVFGVLLGAFLMVWMAYY